MLLAKLPYWAFLGWVGGVVLASIAGQQVFEYAGAIGWCLLTTTTILFYLLTIEAPTVRCEFAGYILMPGGILAVLAGWPGIQFLLGIVGVLAIIVAIVLEVAQRNPGLRQLIYRKPNTM